MAPTESRGQRIHLCLDIDGTIHRHGSVFVESLALLPYDGGLALDGHDRAAIREVLGSVAEYAGGDRSRRRWLRALAVGDAATAIGFGSVVARVLGTFVRIRARRATDDSPDGDPEDYRAMQRRVLAGYGRFLAGRRPETVSAAFDRIIDRHLRVDGAIQRSLSRPGVATTLVTDVPTHVATAYAGHLGDAVDVIGTEFDVAEGRFTGEYDFVAKGPAVQRHRREQRPAVLVVAGDSAADLGMAAAADLFLAVEGRGSIRSAIPDHDRTVALGDLDQAALDPPPDAVIVPRTTSMAAALDRVLDVIEAVDLGD